MLLNLILAKNNSNPEFIHENIEIKQTDNKLFIYSNNILLAEMGRPSDIYSFLPTVLKYLKIIKVKETNLSLSLDHLNSLIQESEDLKLC